MPISLLRTFFYLSLASLVLTCGLPLVSVGLHVYPNPRCNNPEGPTQGINTCYSAICVGEAARFDLSCNSLQDQNMHESIPVGMLGIGEPLVTPSHLPVAHLCPARCWLAYCLFHLGTTFPGLRPLLVCLSSLVTRSSTCPQCCLLTLCDFALLGSSALTRIVITTSSVTTF